MMDLNSYKSTLDPREISNKREVTSINRVNKLDSFVDERIGSNVPLPWNDPEYVRFVQALEGGNNKASTEYGNSGVTQDLLPPSEIYQSLMSKERRALDTVDRVVNDARKTELRSQSLIDMPLNDLLRLVAKTMRLIMTDLIDAQNISDVVRALTMGDRKIVLGTALVLIAIVAAVVKSIS